MRARKARSVPLVTFLQLPTGASFQWVVPPNFRHVSLDRVYVKGAPTTFGDSVECQPFLCEHELNELVRPMEGGAL